jgi:hypothetical protein
MLGGCYGTGYTRWHPAPSTQDASWLGWPLFESVHADFWLLSGGGDSCKDVIAIPFAVLLMPLDLAIDVLLLPADVVAGIAGCSKNRVPSDDAVDSMPR